MNVPWHCQQVQGWLPPCLAQENEGCEPDSKSLYIRVHIREWQWNCNGRTRAFRLCDQIATLHGVSPVPGGGGAGRGSQAGSLGDREEKADNREAHPKNVEKGCEAESFMRRSPIPQVIFHYIIKIDLQKTKTKLLRMSTWQSLGFTFQKQCASCQALNTALVTSS